MINIVTTIPKGYIQIEKHYRFEKLKHIFAMSVDTIVSLQEELERDHKFQFLFPTEINTNKKKTIYKVGFLFYYLKQVYPLKSNESIYKIINRDHQVFLESRQMSRHIKKFFEEADLD